MKSEKALLEVKLNEYKGNSRSLVTEEEMNKGEEQNDISKSAMLKMKILGNMMSNNLGMKKQEFIDKIRCIKNVFTIFS